MTTDSRPRPLAAGDLLTSPHPDARTASAAGRFLSWLENERDLRFTTWDDLWRWSVTDLDGFWSAVWEHFDVRSATPWTAVLAHEEMPGSVWFPGATLNYAEHCLRPVGGRDDADEVAVVSVSQTRTTTETTFAELREQVRRARIALRGLGVGRGDVVAAYLPNIPETLVAFLAASSLGAVFTACAPEFGPVSVVDRFAQVEPSVLLAVDGYRYGTKAVDRREDVARIVEQLPGLRHVVHVPYLGLDVQLDVALDGGPDARGARWGDLLDAAATRPEPLAYEHVPFDHPLYVLFSSGTTGRPKAIVHGHGGILLEHLKNHALHWDLQPGDRLLWFTTTAWMMWNAQASALLCGASMVMIDGDPVHPDAEFQWRLAEQTRPTLMGLSAGYVQLCRKRGITPRDGRDLSSIRQIGVVGSPVSPEAHLWLQENFGPDVLVNVGSGGTDVCTGLVHGSPLQPVWAGEMSGPALGAAVSAFDPDGCPVVGRTGELVVTRPMPSMPVGFWGDPDGAVLRDTYFSMYPGIWRHGDWIRFTERGSCTISGRSDATLNRGGVRLGTADFYEVVEALPQVEDSLVVHVEEDDGPGRLVLFVVPAAGATLDDDLRARITGRLRSELSPRHVPDEVVAVPGVPRNRTGKKLEVPVKRLLQGRALAEVAGLESLADPSALQYIADHADRWGRRATTEEQPTR